MEVSSLLTFPKTNTPNEPTKKKINPVFPHFPGEIQASPENKIHTIMPKFTGLNKCLFLYLIKNLLDIVKKLARHINQIFSVFKSRDKPKAEIKALLMALILIE